MTKPVKYTVEQLIRPSVRKLSAYHVPDARGLTKLDAMESPYNLPAELQTAWLEAVRHVALNRYPGAEMANLREQLKTAMDVPAGMDVLLGNGSDELILILALGLVDAPYAAQHKRPVILSVDPAFVMYELSANAVGLDYVGVPLKSDFSLDVAAMLAAITQHQPALIYIAYPNNPTSNLFGVQDIETIIKAAPGLVVVDEAYHPFAQASFMSRLPEFDNLLVMRTVSKMGLAGIRLGLLAGRPEWIGEFDKLRFPYNINVLTQATALFALQHLDVYAAQATEIRTERARLLDCLQKIPGVQVFPSDANFILFKVPTNQAAAINQGLLKDKVLIKDMSKSFAVLKDYLRVTVGTAAENDQFLASLEHLMACAVKLAK
ncbi:MAG: histidinol-phosphate transaminase [Gammaproteobacteria bacterium]|nr:histidinol-phosphate transaminase [Gammaproteobacteria bacterium]